MGKLLSVVLLLTAFGSYAESVWKVTKNGHTLYLGGTLHLLSQQDYPLPKAYHDAFQACDTLIFETDIATLQSPGFAAQLTSIMLYSDGTRLTDSLSQVTIAQLSAHLATRGITLNKIMKFRPNMLGVVLHVLEYQRLGIEQKGVDQYFFTQGQLSGKTIDWFETPDQQLQFMQTMGVGNENQLIQYTLNELTTLEVSLKQIKSDWLAGDMDAFFNHEVSEFQRMYPSIYRQIIVDRNHNWLPRIKTMLTSDDVEYVLVGTMHMAGEEGLLAMLTREGYQVSPL